MKYSETIVNFDYHIREKNWKKMRDEGAEVP